MKQIFYLLWTLKVGGGHYYILWPQYFDPIDLFAMILRTYPESFMMIGQKMWEKIFQFDFQSGRLKIAHTLQLHYSADL